MTKILVILVSVEIFGSNDATFSFNWVLIKMIAATFCLSVLLQPQNGSRIPIEVKC